MKSTGTELDRIDGGGDDPIDHIAGCAAGATLDRVTSSGTLVNVVVNDYPPFSFINDKNELAGFDIDVAQGRRQPARASKLKNETPGWETISAASGRADGTSASAP